MLLGMMPLWLGGGTLWETMAVTIIWFTVRHLTHLGSRVFPLCFFYVVKLSSIPEAKEMGSITIV